MPEPLRWQRGERRDNPRLGRVRHDILAGGCFWWARIQIEKRRFRARESMAGDRTGKTLRDSATMATSASVFIWGPEVEKPGLSSRVFQITATRSPRDPTTANGKDCVATKTTTSTRGSRIILVMLALAVAAKAEPAVVVSKKPASVP